MGTQVSPDQPTGKDFGFSVQAKGFRGEGGGFRFRAQFCPGFWLRQGCFPKLGQL